MLKEYNGIKDHVRLFTDDLQDPSFHLGKLSASGQLIDLLHACGVLDQLPQEFHQTMALLRIHAVGQIANLIGDKGYDSIIRTYDSPLLSKKDFMC